MGYSSKRIKDELELQSRGWSFLYKHPAILRKGKTAEDTPSKMTEVCAGWIVEHFVEFALGIKQYDRREREGAFPNRPYRTKSHQGEKRDDSDDRSREKNIAYELFKLKRARNRVWDIGDIVDYEVPLKDKQDNRIGNIDLVSRNGDTIYILEMKRPESAETLLRCILEVYTYFRSIKSVEKFKRSFCDDGEDLQKINIVIAPLIFRNSNRHASPYKNIDKDDHKEIVRLIDCMRKGSTDDGVDPVGVEVMVIDAGSMNEHAPIEDMDFSSWEIIRQDI